MPDEAPESRPHLEVVGEEAPRRQGASPAPERAEARAARRGFWLLAVLLILAAIALGVQTRRVGELEGEIRSLGGELDAAREEISAYQGQLGQVRGLVDDLGARLEALRELVHSDPRDTAPEPRGEAL